MAFPQGITVVRATSPQGGMSFSLSPFLPAPVAHQRPKSGSLPPPAPLPCGAPPRRAGGGQAKPNVASLFRNARGKSVLSRFQCGVSGRSRATTARAPPSLREASWRSKKWPIQVAHPPRVNGPPLRRHLPDPQRRNGSGRGRVWTVPHATGCVGHPRWTSNGR